MKHNPNWLALLLLGFVLIDIGIAIGCADQYMKAMNEGKDIVIEIETESEPEYEPVTQKVEIVFDPVIIPEDVQEEETEPEPHYEDLIIGTRYTLGTGVRVRKSPSSQGEIYKTLEEIFTPVQITDENSEWTEICMDGGIYYIYGKLVGGETAVKKKKAEIELDYQRRKTAYYEVFKNMTDEEYDLLVRILALEAGNEPFKGKLAVVEVIMNRVISRNPYFPDTVGGVLRQKGQFETLKYLSHPYNKPKDSDYEAIEYVRNNGATAIRGFLDEAGMTSVSSLDYVYFATFKANGRDFLKYGGHYFSRDTMKKYWHVRQ